MVQGYLFQQFAILTVPVDSTDGRRSASVPEDNASTDNFIMHKVNTKVRLLGKPTSIFIKGLGDEYREKLTIVYSLDVVDAERESHRIEAIGMTNLTDMLPAVGVAKLAELFPDAPPAAAEAFNRPHKAVSLMVGMKDRKLHCTDGLEKGNQRLCRTRFQHGRCSQVTH